MKTIRNISLVAILVLLAVGLSAGKYNERKGIGLHFGTASGSGYAMRWMGDQFGFQLTMGAYTKGSNKVNFRDHYYDYDAEYTPDVNGHIWRKISGRSTKAAIGLNGIMVLDRFNKGSFYVVGGGSMTTGKKTVFSAKYLLSYSGSDSNSYRRVAMEPIKSEKVNVHDWIVGVGPGIELALTRHFRLAFEVPITYDDSDDIVMYIPQVGFYYYFK
ncbi:MAG TPA: hypothetical protein PL126_03795 [Candidatus Cloacimonadota bacterium]|nr:hypothetical protein [Candidatus Cloacimonadota bacterium]